MASYSNECIKNAQSWIDEIDDIDAFLDQLIEVNENCTSAPSLDAFCSSFALDTTENLISSAIEPALLQILLGEHISKVPYTKFVFKTSEDELVSWYDRFYKYKVGEVHFPKNLSECGSGVYCHKGFAEGHYGNTCLEVEPLSPKENTLNEVKFGYKEGVLVKQVLPFNTEEGYYTWLEEVKEIPSNVVKYLKLLKGN